MYTYLKTLVTILAFSAISCGGGEENTQTPPALPQLTTAEITDITPNAARSGGNVIADGGSSITVRGVVWDTETAPVVTLSSKTVNGEGLGSFNSAVSALNSGTTYYLRAYATNSQGTFYGNEITFETTTQQLVLGQNYQGGIIVYLFKSGDLGYNPAVQHGFIANTDVIDNNIWDWGCNSTLQNGTSAAFGSGMANTQWLAAHCTEQNSGINFCNTYSTGGYSDWFMPSKDELLKIYPFNDIMDDIYFIGNKYFSSTEASATKAWAVDFTEGTGTASQVFKNDIETNFCPIRKF